jgi:hypothetical protein
MTESYNGWRNYATWRIHLEIFDGLNLSDWGWHKLESYELGREMREYAEQLLEEESGRPGKAGPFLCLSYALAFLSDVDWREIAESMLAACEAESDEESESCE